MDNPPAMGEEEENNPCLALAASRGFPFSSSFTFGKGKDVFKKLYFALQNHNKSLFVPNAKRRKINRK